MSGTKRERVLVEVTVPAPMERVWTALRDREQIANWFGWDAETLPAEIDFIFFDHAHAEGDGTVLRFEEHEGVADRFELERRGDATLLRVVRSQIDDGTDWSDIYEDMTEGWISFVAQLRFWLARHDGQDRRTLYLSGKAPAGGMLPHALFGLGGSNADAASVEVGGRRAEGRVWHRSVFQTGIVVPDWGDALLVVVDRPAGGSAPNGGRWLVLTTFGLDEATFTDLSQQLTDRWAQAFPVVAAEGQ